MIPAPPHRLSHEMKGKCCREDEIIDVDAPIGTIHDCPTCGMSFVNDSGLWRSTLTMDRRKLDKIIGIGHAFRITRGLG